MSIHILATAEDQLVLRLLEPSEEMLRAGVAGEDLQARLHVETMKALNQIDNPIEHEVTETIFHEILRAFDRLTLIETNLHKLDTLLENLSILDVLQFEIRYLIDFIENDAMHADGVGEKLLDVLNGISYGISHDVKRVFERELSGEIRDQSTPVVYGKILHAHGLLSNCLQQSIITLLQVFNPTLDPSELFNDFEERVTHSLLLCKELSSLMRVVRDAESQNTPDKLREVVQHAIKFRDGSMQYLMYRDWRGYERLALALITSIESNCDSTDLLNQFGCYLEVLYGHVKMRAVLRDMFPSSSEVEE